jgi:hypothetical protein
MHAITASAHRKPTRKNLDLILTSLELRQTSEEIRSPPIVKQHYMKMKK